MSMNREIKSKWVAALRSGEYKQARSYLCAPDGTGHCCLGVLTDLYAKEKGIPFDHTTASLKFMGAETLAYQVREWAGLETGSPYVTAENGFCEQLVNLNDGWDQLPQHSFAQIADLIEKSNI